MQRVQGGGKNISLVSQLYSNKELCYHDIYKVKVVISVHVIEAYGGVEIQLHPLTVSADD